MFVMRTRPKEVTVRKIFTILSVMALAVVMLAFAGCSTAKAASPGHSVDMGTHYAVLGTPANVETRTIRGESRPSALMAKAVIAKARSTPLRHVFTWNSESDRNTTRYDNPLNAIELKPKIAAYNGMGKHYPRADG